MVGTSLLRSGCRVGDDHREGPGRDGDNREEQGIGTNDRLMGDVLRRHEMHVWFIAEHVVEAPLVEA
jgi:starvation-inducible DNA-binding protein